MFNCILLEMCCDCEPLIEARNFVCVRFEILQKLSNKGQACADFADELGVLGWLLYFVFDTAFLNLIEPAVTLRPCAVLCIFSVKYCVINLHIFA